jgi:hypothetical protein
MSRGVDGVEGIHGHMEDKFSLVVDSRTSPHFHVGAQRHN